MSGCFLGYAFSASHDSDYYLNAKKIGKEGDNLALEVKIVPGTNNRKNNFGQ